MAALTGIRGKGAVVYAIFQVPMRGGLERGGYWWYYFTQWDGRPERDYYQLLRDTRDARKVEAEVARLNAEQDGARRASIRRWAQRRLAIRREQGGAA